MENGEITTLDNVTVPPLEMSYLVAENTSVSVNKATVPAGQYVTVRAAYELDEKVSSTGQTLVVDLTRGLQPCEWQRDGGRRQRQLFQSR